IFLRQGSKRKQKLCSVKVNDLSLQLEGTALRNGPGIKKMGKSHLGHWIQLSVLPPVIPSRCRVPCP
uniref:Uncharacterized protein n=1 Tax=Naja naja TaxID=35670 RepID=A0A8C6V492_NAJNA